MTLTDAIAALVILGFFLAGFSQAFIPAVSAYEQAMAGYGAAKTIEFIAGTFREECGKPDRNIENWKRNVSIAKELESCVIVDILREDVLAALKLQCVISGEYYEVIGVVGTQ